MSVTDEENAKNKVLEFLNDYVLIQEYADKIMELCEQNSLMATRSLASQIYFKMNEVMSIRIVRWARNEHVEAEEYE